MINQKKEINEAGQLCWYCGAPVIKLTPKKRSRNKSYYYEYYFRCSNRNCPKRFFYMPEAAKRFWPENANHNGASPQENQS